MDANQTNPLQLNGTPHPLLIDVRHVTMAYAYWKNNKSDNVAFELLFRENPFKGQFTVFAGLEECLKFLQNFRFPESDINFVKNFLPPTVEEEFFEFLKEMTVDEVKVFAVPEGTVVFPMVPLMRVEGPLPVVQLLGTTLLVLVNYASLVATNAVRFRLAAGPDVGLLEFGQRMAQGPDGGLSASRYAYLGGFDATSNVLAGRLYGIPVNGAHAHSFVMAYSSSDDTSFGPLRHKDSDSEEVDLPSLCKMYRIELEALLLVSKDEAVDNELTSFIAFAMSFPDDFLVLVDTYDVLRSGMLNFCAVALALNVAGYQAVGVQIDRGDLSYLSIIARTIFSEVGEAYDLPWFQDMRIVVACTDINEERISSLNEQGHSISCFAVSTHLVTCQNQPALGCVFELVEVNSNPCSQLTPDLEQISIPGRKCAYRLFGNEGYPLVDLMQLTTEPPPEPFQKVLARHPFQASKRAHVRPVEVFDLIQPCFAEGEICTDLLGLDELRERVKASVATLRPDMRRNTPHKVSVSDQLYHFMHSLWLQRAPIAELH